MARTKQTARKVTGGIPPRRSLLSNKKVEKQKPKHKLISAPVAAMQLYDIEFIDKIPCKNLYALFSNKLNCVDDVTTHNIKWDKIHDLVTYGYNELSIIDGFSKKEYVDWGISNLNKEMITNYFDEIMCNFKQVHWKLVNNKLVHEKCPSNIPVRYQIHNRVCTWVGDNPKVQRLEMWGYAEEHRGCEGYAICLQVNDLCMMVSNTTEGNRAVECNEFMFRNSFECRTNMKTLTDINEVISFMMNQAKRYIFHPDQEDPSDCEELVMKKL
jgi:hypothetical protein